jgi:F-type H+-transporting ATPase subunit b
MEKLGLDHKLLLAQIINFALVFFLIKKYLAPFFLETVQKEKRIEKEKEEAELLFKEQKDKLIKEENKKRQEWERQAERVLKEAEERGEKQRLEIIKKAKIEAEELKEKAKRQIAVEQKTAEKAIKRKIVELGTSIVNKGLKDYLDEEGQKRITQYIIKNYSQVSRKDE